MDYCKLIREAAKKHICEIGEYPLEDAGYGMYNLDVDIPTGIDKRLDSKYDIIIQCYPEGEYDKVYLLVYYDVDSIFGSVDNDCYCLTDFSEDVQKQIYARYLNNLDH